MKAADVGGRLPLSRMSGWDVFPFEQAGLRVVPLARPVLPEPARAGETAADCPACTAGRVPVWSDEHWRLSPSPPARRATRRGGHFRCDPAIGPDAGCRLVSPSVIICFSFSSFHPGESGFVHLHPVRRIAERAASE
jgi:hypothetical protein